MSTRGAVPGGRADAGLLSSLPINPASVANEKSGEKAKEKLLLCFDYGRKRIGVAVGQTLSATARPLETVAVRRNRPDWERIAALIRQWAPHALLVGEPRQPDGTAQEMTAAADKFARQLAGRHKLPIYRTDEYLSSYAARQRVKATRHLDPVAAQIMLEAWLADRESHSDAMDG